MPSVVAGDRRIARESGGRGRQRVDGLIEEPEVVDPIEDVAPAVAPRKPATAPDGEVHVSAGAQELVRDLTPRLAASDDEDGSAGKLLGTPILTRGEMLDRRGVDSRESRSRLLERASRDHDIASFDRVVSDFEPEPTVIEPHRRDWCVLANRRAERARVPLETVDDVAERSERVGLVPRVLPPGKPLCGMGRVQEEAVPALRAPRLGDPSALEDDVLAIVLGEEEAGRESRLACADDGRVHALHRRLLRRAPASPASRRGRRDRAAGRSGRRRRARSSPPV